MTRAGSPVARLVPALLALLLLVVLAAGCSGSSGGQGSGDARGGEGSGETEPRETIRGTTSQGSTEEAESTVGTVSPEPTGGENAGSEAAGSGTAGSGTADSGIAEAESGSAEPAGTRSVERSGEASAASRPEPAPSPQTAPQTESEELQAAAELGEFVASPEDSGGSGYGADGILGVRFGDHQGYERVVVDLGSGGQPASGVPVWTLSSPTGDGRLKLSFPSVRNTAVSDGSLENAGAELLDSFYVVRGPDGGMFVDFFAERAFYYRVVELEEPGRVAIDFRASGSELAIPLPVREGNTVVTQPRRGDTVTSPMIVSGYSRNPEASNTILLQGPAGRPLARETVLSNDWTSTWGYFETTLDFRPFTGAATLKVGTQSARDGSFQGVELPVQR